MKVKESEAVKRERREHPERFAPKSAPPGFGGYSVAYIAQVLRETKEEIARRKASVQTN